MVSRRIPAIAELGLFMVSHPLRLGPWAVHDESSNEAPPQTDETC